MGATLHRYATDYYLRYSEFPTVTTHINLDWENLN